jgi:hypothetical protein
MIKHSLGPEIPIIILLLGTRIHLGFLHRRLGVQHVDRIFIQRIDILFTRRHFDLDLVLVAPSASRHSTQRGCGLVVAFGTP